MLRNSSLYVRIAPLVIDGVPNHLTLCHLRWEIGLPRNQRSRTPASDSTYLILHRNRFNKESFEVTYLSTDSVRVMGDPFADANAEDSGVGAREYVQIHIQ